jgi:crossover junction endodeoxyribonuclease RuvC
VLILGLDPGSLHTGYGLVEKVGPALVLREAGRISCRKELPLPVRLARLGECAAELVARWRPDLAALESPFHGPNARSLIVLAQARGALLAAVAGAGVAVHEYTPAEVKSAVTGNGRADKQQVARMLAVLLALSRDPAERPAHDATDALAVAVCCAHRLRHDRLRAALK